MQKILIGDPDTALLNRIRNAPGSEHYTFEEAHTGEELLKKLATFQPDLVMIDLMIPHMHGIELLKRIRSNPKTEGIGVIIASPNSMIQNCHAALQAGADYFLVKPFEIPFLYILFNRFFEGNLLPDPLPSPPPTAEHEVYHPKTHEPDSYLHFWGTRGSNPVSGADYDRFGGNTSCLEVRHGDDLIIFDAGTGILPLGQAIDTTKHKTIHLFISHTHWDHITGFPFFDPVYNPNVHLVIWTPVGFEKSTKELLTEMLAYDYFPVRLEDMKAKLSFNDLRDGHSVSIGNIKIDCHYAYHPGATLCFKIHIAGKTYGYATDNELFLGYHGNPNNLGPDHPLIKSQQSLIDFYKNTDVLIHEAQYTQEEYEKRVGWGHSSVANAAILCKYAQITEWIVTHHDPKHTDQMLLEKLQLQRDILQQCQLHCHTQMAYDGMKLML
ncbi:MAG: response regulator [Verrucomicrobia bacterium]|nr:response regulator [Verrucomicrobiota bacterium]